jgi:hypothetical protein
MSWLWSGREEWGRHFTGEGAERARQRQERQASAWRNLRPSVQGSWDWAPFPAVEVLGKPTARQARRRSVLVPCTEEPA